MPRLRFPCLTCGKTLEVDDSLAGKLAWCPRCGRNCTIPAAKIPEPPPTDWSASTQPARRFPIAALIGAGVGLVALGFAVMMASLPVSNTAGITCSVERSGWAVDALIEQDTLWVALIVRNNGPKPAALNKSDVKLVDEDDTAYAWYPHGASAFTQLAPSKERRGSIAATCPKEHQYRLLVFGQPIRLEPVENFFPPKRKSALR